MTDTVHAISEADRIYAQELERQQKQAHKKDVLLDVDDLSVTLFTEDGALPAIQHLSFIMRRG